MADNKPYTDIRLSPFIRFAYDHNVGTSKWSCGPRVIFDYEIIYLKKGHLRVEVETETYCADPGDFIFLRPKQHHALYSISSIPIYQPHIHFDLIEDDNSRKIGINFTELNRVPQDKLILFREDLYPILCPEIKPVMHLSNHEALGRRFLETIHMANIPNMYSELKAKGMFLEFLGNIFQEIRWEENKTQESDNSWLDKAVMLINESVTRELSLDELAERIHVNKFTLTKKFKAYYGISPIQYHQNIRMNKAKQLLESSGLPIRAIAETLGFKDLFTFSRAFKNKTGIPPTAYKSTSTAD